MFSLGRTKLVINCLLFYCLREVVSCAFLSSSRGRPTGDSCGNDEFRCSDGECIGIQLICDQDYDCNDYSDEADCTYHLAACTADEFECSNGQCISSTFRCNNDADCGDESDELGCSICSSHMFQCLDLLSCIPSEWRCDSGIDCGDGSDEFDCDIPTPDPGFTCFNGTWIPEMLRCDSIPHCGMGEDESDCTACEYDGFLCSNRRCIPASGYCDGVDDCGNWSDEPQSCNDWCNAESSPCPGQPMICANTPGSYRCLCPPSFVYDAEKHTCYSNEYISPTVIFASRRHVMYLSHGDHNVTTPFTADANLYDLVAIDFNSHEGSIFLSANQKILKLSMHDEPSVVAGTGVEEVYGLAFDWVYGNLYFTEEHHRRIEVIDMNTLMRRVLYDTDLEKPRAIAVDPRHGYLYFTDSGRRNPKIEKAGMDGTYREVIISENLEWPNGLCIEYTLRRLFWVNAFFGHEGSYIASSDMDGGNVKILVEGTSRVRHPFGITVLQDKLYWTDWKIRGVLTANSFTGDDFSVVLDTPYSPRGIRLFNRRVQYDNAQNMCPTDKHDACSHMCLASPNRMHYSCSCPGNNFLGEDNKTCFCNNSVALGKDGISCRISVSSTTTDTPRTDDILSPVLPTGIPTQAVRVKLPMNCQFQNRVLRCESKVTDALPADAPLSIKCEFFTTTGALECSY